MSAPLIRMRPALRRHEAQQQLDDGRLARAGRPRQYQRLAGRDAEAHVLQRRAAGRVPGEADMLERDRNAMRRHGADRRAIHHRSGRGRHRGERLGCGRGVRAVLVGDGKRAQGGEELGDQQQHEHGFGRIQPVRRRRRAVADGEQHQRQRDRAVQRCRRDKRHPQHPHGAPPELVRRLRQRGRLVRRPAGQHDGGNPTHPVEEARLQPGHRGELPADATAAPMPDTACATGTSSPAAPRISAPTGSAMATHTSTSSGPAIARLAAGSQRAKKPSSASIRSTTVVLSAAECSPRSTAGPLPAAGQKHPVATAGGQRLLPPPRCGPPASAAPPAATMPRQNPPPPRRPPVPVGSTRHRGLPPRIRSGRWRGPRRPARTTPPAGQPCAPQRFRSATMRGRTWSVRS